MIRPIVALAGLMLCPGFALALDMPAGAQLVSERISPLDSYALPVGPFADDAVPKLVVEGRVERRTWRMRGTATSLQILAPLRAQLEAEGFDVLFDCAAAECGGFDFRFGTEVVPAPDMHVDIRDFRFLSAMQGEDRPISLLVSRNQTTAYVQVIEVMPAEETAAPDAPAQDVPAGDLGARLLADGHVVLGDLEFVSGAGRLGPGPYGSLEALAAVLAENPALRLVLVGHTDSIGALNENIALSKQRAQAVRQRLIEAHGVAPEQVEGEGMGYLAPVASNLTAEGREANRRVEAVVLAN